MDNDNGTASGQPCRNRRATTQYNPQYNVPTSQLVSNQHGAIDKFVLNSALDGKLIMDSWGGNQGMLAYQAVVHVTLTPVDPTIFKAKNGIYPNETSLIEALSSPQSEQWTKSMTEEITNLVKRWTWDLIKNLRYLREPR